MSYFNIKIMDVPESGMDMQATLKDDPWVKTLLKDALDDDVKVIRATLQAKLVRSFRTVEAIGGIHLTLGVLCDRCLKAFETEEQVSFRFILEPAPKSIGKAEEEIEDEEMNESIDFSYYYGDDVDLGDLIRQHIMLAQPINFICKSECKGLCVNCGKNLNNGKCGCKPEDTDSPFAVLKDLKK